MTPRGASRPSWQSFHLPLRKWKDCLPGEGSSFRPWPLGWARSAVPRPEGPFGGFGGLPLARVSTRAYAHDSLFPYAFSDSADEVSRGS